MNQEILKQAAKNLGPVPPESKLPKTGGEIETFKQALDSIKIESASEESLIGALRYCMVLVGLRAASFPQQEETALLKNFIQRNYGKNTIAEIRLAFDMAVAGKLSVDATCYENFSVAYFAKIMNAYLKWAVDFYEDNRLYNDTPKLTALPASPTDWKELCELRYQDYLSGTYNLDMWPVELYDQFVRSNMMAADTYEDFLNDGKRKVIADLNSKKDVLDPRVHALKIGGIMMELGEVRLFGIAHQKVIAAAKKLAVQFLYSEANKRGFKNVFTDF